jgi:hypothetical protein
MEIIMPGTSDVKLQQMANTFGLNGGNFDKPKARVSSEISKARDESPCFGTDKRHDCAEMCNWRRECRKSVAAWLR